MTQHEAAFQEILGETIASIDIGSDHESLRFELHSGVIFELYHEQECCESVTLEEIIGDLDDLLDYPVIRAECNASENPDICETWTFYRIQTAKGLVVLRWCGGSNGYYSEQVDCRRWLPEAK